MKILVFFLVLFPIVCFSQKIFSVEYASQADIKVYVVDYKSEADLNVFKLNYFSQSKIN